MIQIIFFLPDTTKTKRAMVECDMCNRSIDTEEFEKHWKEVHSTIEVSAEPASTCSICDKVLNKEEYLTHFKVRINDFHKVTQYRKEVVQSGQKKRSQNLTIFGRFGDGNLNPNWPKAVQIWSASIFTSKNH